MVTFIATVLSVTLVSGLHLSGYIYILGTQGIGWYVSPFLVDKFVFRSLETH